MEEKSMISKIDFEASKKKAQELINLYEKNHNIKFLDDAMNYDNTLPQIYINKLKLEKNDYKIKERSYDILEKNQLKKFDIIKLSNHKEIYFDIIHYLENVVLNESFNEVKDENDNDFETEDFEENEIDEELEKKEEQKIEILVEEQKKLNEKNEKKEISNILGYNEQFVKIELNMEIKDYIDAKNDDNLSDSEYKKYLKEKENLDIKNILILGETKSINEIKEKLKIIYKHLFSFLNYRNNIPDFESEYFYFNCLRYMLETFDRLKKKKFYQKILLQKALINLTEKIETGKINNKLMKIYFYYIINTQYYIEKEKINLLINIDEEKILNDSYEIKGNSLYKNKKKVIDNIEYYSINEICKLYDSKKEEQAKSILIIYPENYYNIIGVLMNLQFKKEDGDKYWKEFLLSPILENLISHLFKNKKNNFKEENIIKLFQNNSYYFPNQNSDFTAISHKELFLMYFSPRNISVNEPILYNSNFRIIANRAFNKVDIQHEWGHTSSAFLFFNTKINYFDTPKRTLKISNSNSNNLEKVETIKEGGEAVEYLLYGRIIEELNAKEAIYILNSNNYKKNLNDFLYDFMDLKNHKLIDILEEAIKNKEIEKCIIDSYYEYKNKNNKFKNIIENFNFKAKLKKPNIEDYENFTFKCKPRKHFNHSYFIKKLNLK